MAKCDDAEVKHLKCNYNNSGSARTTLQTAVATLANIKELKSEQEECVNVFIKGKDIVCLPLT